MDLDQLRLRVYRTFAVRGRAPLVAELAERLGADAAEISAGLQQLAAARHLVPVTSEASDSPGRSGGSSWVLAQPDFLTRDPMVNAHKGDLEARA